MRLADKNLRVATFQSSPALTGGCYILPTLAFSMTAAFQSSPALTGGCYLYFRRQGGGRLMFQSSPALTGGCYDTGSSPPCADVSVVSILTRPYGRMLCLAVQAATRGSVWFQSSPALTGGCYRKPVCEIRVSFRRFNPHPPLRADAMLPGQYLVTSWRLFQSSPALTGGCYCQEDGNRLMQRQVSILTRPYGRMLSA